MLPSPLCDGGGRDAWHSRDSASRIAGASELGATLCGGGPQKDCTTPRQMQVARATEEGIVSWACVARTNRSRNTPSTAEAANNHGGSLRRLVEAETAARGGAHPAWRACEGAADHSGRMICVGRPVLGPRRRLVDVVEVAEIPWLRRLTGSARAVTEERVAYYHRRRRARALQAPSLHDAAGA